MSINVNYNEAAILADKNYIAGSKSVLFKKIWLTVFQRAGLKYDLADESADDICDESLEISPEDKDISLDTYSVATYSLSREYKGVTFYAPKVKAGVFTSNRFAITKKFTYTKRISYIILMWVNGIDTRLTVEQKTHDGKRRLTRVKWNPDLFDEITESIKYYHGIMYKWQAKHGQKFRQQYSDI